MRLLELKFSTKHQPHSYKIWFEFVENLANIEQKKSKNHQFIGNLETSISYCFCISSNSPIIYMDTLQNKDFPIQISYQKLHIQKPHFGNSC